MNLFEKAKVKKVTKKCHSCDGEFIPDKRNVNRGWGLCCSKSCATFYKNKLNRMKATELTKELRDMKLSQLGI